MALVKVVCYSCKRLVVDHRLLCLTCPDLLSHEKDVPNLNIEMILPQ